MRLTLRHDDGDQVWSTPLLGVTGLSTDAGYRLAWVQTEGERWQCYEAVTRIDADVDPLARARDWRDQPDELGDIEPHIVEVPS